MSRAAEIIGRFEARRPLAVRLAEVVSLAVLVDPLLLRRARRRFVPEADAGTEADLWLSPLVRTRSPDGLVFPPEVAEALRQRLQGSGRLEEAWELTRELHGHLPPALQLEEEIAWLSASRGPGTADRIEELLRSALAALVVGERRGLAHWAARAMSTLPSQVREHSETASMLRIGAHLRLDGNAAPARSQEGLPDWLSWVAPADLPHVPVRVRLFPGEVVFDSASTEEGNVLSVPETVPLLIDLMWEKQGEERAVQVTLRRGEVVTVPIEAGEVRLRTLAGEVYRLRAESGSHEYRSMAPLAPEPFLHNAELEQVIQTFLTASRGDRAAAVGIVTALLGAGGFGKTALAAAVCRDERIQRAYPDGILWTTMGDRISSIDRTVRVRNLVRWWTGDEPPVFETASAAGAFLLNLLVGKRVLLVIDDVWEAEDINLFRGLGPGSALLITTRTRSILPQGSFAIEINTLALSEAVRLLGEGLPDTDADSLRSLAVKLGHWPLLLVLVNRLLRSEVDRGLSPDQALQEVENSLASEGLTAFDRLDLGDRASSVARVLEVSLRRLSSEESNFYRELAIFPADVDVPLSILETLWGLSSHAARRLCLRLYESALLLRFDSASGTIRLHDVLRAYLLEGSTGLATVHQRLLAGRRPASGRWSDMPKSESYLWHHLFYHLIGGKEVETCRALLLDFDYLQGKLAATSLESLLSDYALFAEKDPDLQLVAEAVRLSISAKDRQQSAFKILGRFLTEGKPGIRQIRRLVRSLETSEARLRSGQGSFSSSGSVLIRTLAGSEGIVSAAAAEGNYAVLGLADGSLELWDLDSSKLLRSMKGHLGAVTAVAMVDRYRVVSGSEDGTLRLWDLRSGALLRTLEGHFGGTSVVAVVDGRRLVSASQDGTLRLWDLDTGVALRTLTVDVPLVAVDLLEINTLLVSDESGAIRRLSFEI